MTTSSPAGDARRRPSAPIAATRPSNLGDWPFRPLDGITRRDIENRFHLITERHGAVPANQTLSFLRSVYRRPCVDHDGLRKRCPRDGARVPKYATTHTAGGIAPRSLG